MAGRRQPPRGEQPGGEGGGGRLNPHRLVRKLIPEGSTGPPNAVLLHGYPGDAPAPGRFLLWLSLDLTESVEGDDADILHNETLPDDGGELVWVRAGARLEYRHTRAADVEASFLGGAITSAHLAAAAAPQVGAAAFPGGFAATFPPVCITRLPPCPVTVPIIACPRVSIPPRCPWTQDLECPPTQNLSLCPSEFLPCSTDVGNLRCPTQMFGCPSNIRICPRTIEFPNCFP
jgi:hypothetical protein